MLARLLLAVPLALLLGVAPAMAPPSEPATPRRQQIVPDSLLPAFAGPGGIAQGWGALALNECRDRPIAVRKVTNTNATGPGSLSAAVGAVSNATFDFIVFTAGGRLFVTPTDALRDSEFSCAYIAGQTAPGGGFTITRTGFRIWGPGASAVDNSAGCDVVVRYLTFGKSTLNKFDVCLLVLDHITCFWGGSLDSNCITIGTRPDAPGEFDDMPWEWTLSNSLIYEMHESHPTVCHTNGHRGTTYGNVLAGPGHRLCLMTTNRMASSGIEFIHNVGYNWFARGLSTARDYRVDVEANYYKRGPATDASTPSYKRFPFLDRDLCPDEPFCMVSPFGQNNRSVENNFGLTLSPDSSFGGSQRQFACQVTDGGVGICNADGDPIPPDSVRSEPLPFTPDWPVERGLFTDELYELTLDGAGNSERLTCDGTWVERRSTMDAAAIANVRNGTGRSAPVNFAGGATPDPDEPGWVVPVPATGTACTDTSGDGIPDAYYERWGYSPADSIAHTRAASGHLLLERYLDGANPNDPTPWYPSTFGVESLRRFYVAPTISILAGSLVTPDTAVVPLGYAQNIILNTARDSALVMTCQGFGEAMDSTALQALVARWNRPSMQSAANLRDRDVPGSDC